MLSQEHYHYATGHEAKNKGKLYRCPSKSCCLIEAYDKEGWPMQG